MTWQRRYEDHQSRRRAGRLSTAECQKQLMRCLDRLVKGRHCDPKVMGRLHHKTDPRTQRTVIGLAPSADTPGRHPALVLKGLSTLQDGALLTLVVQLRHAELLTYSIGLRGRPRESVQPWYCRIDLHEDGDAEFSGESHGGYCNHPLLHCHIGADPEQREYPKVRAPLDWLQPWEALEWLLATTDGRLEPEPRGPAQVRTDDPADVARWAAHLQIPQEQLFRLVREVGPSLPAIRVALKPD